MASGNLSRPFIERPVATTLLMLALLLAGIVALRQLPLSALPQVDYPTIQVTTLYPGAGPEVITSSITAPLERQFGQMPGLDQMYSQGSAGASVITLRFGLQLALDVAEQQVQAAINAAANLLPADLPAPPVYSKVNPADAPIVTLALTSESLPLTRVADLADTRVAQKLSQLPGVGLVTLSGGQRPAMRVQVDPKALAAKGLTLADVRTAIANWNANLAKGSFDGPARASTIDANDQLRSAEDYRAMVLAYRNGSPLRLADVAQVEEGPENVRLAAWSGTADRPVAPGIVVSVQRQPGANVIEVADRVKALLPQLAASLPQSVDLRPLTDRTVTIRASIADVRTELLVSVALVVLVIFVFLRSARATVIPAVAVPLSLVGTFGAMWAAGYSIDNLSLMALTIATGFVVDDAIVMIENITRYIEAGDSPLQAALEGSRQIGFTIVSLTLSLIAVLIPLLFMGDVVGRLFREFAVTLAVAILLSAVVSLTLTPMMCARLLRRGEGEHGRLARAVGRGFDRLAHGYARALDAALGMRPLVLAVWLAAVALTALLYVAIPKGFFPLQDTGLVQATLEAPQSTGFAAMSRRMRDAAEALRRDPAVASVSALVGVDGVNPTLASGRLLIALAPRGRREPLDAVLARLSDAAHAAVADATLYLQPVQDLTVEDRTGRTPYQFTLQDPDPAALSAWVPRVVERLRAMPQLHSVAGDLQDRGLQAYIEIDRDAAARLGITVAAIDNALYDAFGQRLVSTVFTQSNQYRVVLVADTGPLAGPAAAGAIQLATAGGTPVPLTAVARIVEREGPLAVMHLDQFPAASVSFDLVAGASLGEAVAAIEQAVREVGLPASTQLAFQGAALAFRAALGNELWLVLAAIVTMYIVLGVLYESFVHPVTILSTLPSAGIGALAALMLTGGQLDIVSIIGIVLLIGIVKKNAIMMVDFALEAERERGVPPLDAIREACRLRLRPILMTTAAALLGALPLALGTGVGSELRHPLGVAMVGGLLVSQVLTLFTTPVIYLAFDRFVRRPPADTGAGAGAGAGPGPGVGPGTRTGPGAGPGPEAKPGSGAGSGVQPDARPAPVPGLDPDPSAA